jgi:hypothetical protein
MIPIPRIACSKPVHGPLRNKFLFRSRNQILLQIFDLYGTFRVGAAQQILDTLCLD